MATKSYWHRFQRGRVSRRRLIGTAGAGAAGLAVAAACGGGGGGGEATVTPEAAVTPTGEGTPKAGGRYRSFANVDWGTLDPVVSVGGATGIFARMYNALLDRSRTQPDFWFFDLAEEVEQPDEETYDFAIRPGVKIGPNDLGIPERDMDSSDAKGWLDRITQDEEAVHRAFSEEWLASYDAPDAQNFQIKTNGPYAYFFFRIGSPLGGTMPPKEFFEQGIDLRDKGVGGGPFVLTKYEETGDLSFDRNPNYYRKDDTTGEQLPYLDGRDVVRITDRLARRTAFIDGQLHNYEAENADEKDELLGLVPDSYSTKDPVNTFISVTVNPTRVPWDDENIRKALLYALDRQEFVDRIVGPEGGQPDGLVHWPTGPYALSPEELEELQPHDPQRSRDLIREATGNDTISVPVIYPTGVDLQYHAKHLSIFLKQMREAGFNVQEQPLDFGTWLARYTDVDYDASLSLNQTYETAEITLDWQSSKGPQGDGNFAVGIGALYPELDEAILASKQVTDQDEHVKRVLDAQRLAYEHGPAFLPIMSWYAFFLYQGFVKGVPRGLGGAGQYLNTSWLDL